MVLAGIGFPIGLGRCDREDAHALLGMPLTICAADASPGSAGPHVVSLIGTTNQRGADGSRSGHGSKSLPRAGREHLGQGSDQEDDQGVAGRSSPHLRREWGTHGEQGATRKAEREACHSLVVRCSGCVSSCNRFCPATRRQASEGRTGEDAILGSTERG